MADFPVEHYDGNYITCYPGSNQTDEGKFNMEFNMARLVTRITSKNFCIVKPSFELSKIRSSLGKPQVRIGVGQCSINGMDLIMTTTLDIDVPQDAGTYYLVFKLWRDGSRNVKGDEVYGVTKTFQGLYVTWADEKPEPLTDPDTFFIGKITYDGTDITELEEDEDKYGRIWAEDILAKIKDPKHPDISRLILQDWIYLVPDWYVSKEGDVEFEAIEWLPGRQDGEYTSEDYGTGKYGIHIQATSNNNAEMILKAPTTLTTDPDRLLKAYGTNNGIEIDIGRSKLVSNSNNDFALNLTTPRNINVNSDGTVSLIGKTGISLGTGTNGTTPKYLLKDNKATLTSTLDGNIKDEVVFASGTLQHIIGKSILQYTTSNTKLSLLDTNTSIFDISPNIDMLKKARVKDTLYIGNNGTYGNDPTYLQKQKWQLSDGTNSIVMTPSTEIITNAGNGSAYIQVKQNDNKYAKLFNNGKLELKNSDTSIPPQILLTDGSYNATIKLTNGKKGDGTGAVSILDITAGHTKLSGDLTATGDIRANRVYNAIYNDICEFMEKEDYNEIIEAGDVVYFNESGKVSKYHKGINPTAIAGVVSSEETYGYALGGDGLEDNQKVPVALKGRVYVKTDNTDFHAGDFVAVDSCGCVYKGDKHIYDNFVLGIATKPEENGKVFIMIR